MSRIIFTLTDEMEADLKAEANKRGASVSNLIRIYLAQGLSADNGKPVEVYRLSVGGDRRAGKDGEPED